MVVESGERVRRPFGIGAPEVAASKTVTIEPVKRELVDVNPPAKKQKDQEYAHEQQESVPQRMLLWKIDDSSVNYAGGNEEKNQNAYWCAHNTDNVQGRITKKSIGLWLPVCLARPARI